MNILDISDPITLLLLTLGTVLLIFLGRELKKSYIPAIPLVGFLILTVFHIAQLITLGDATFEQYQPILLRCISIDCIMIFVTFFAYLWIDDIECKFKKKKSIDNSLDWLWRSI